jgi:hypothetical protein
MIQNGGQNMTEKENFLAYERGRTGWVPRYGQMPDPYSTYKPAVTSVRCAPTSGIMNPDGSRVDIFGVEYTATDSTAAWRCHTGQFIWRISQSGATSSRPEPRGNRLEAVAKKAWEH